jgi:hypothetical protein
MHIRLVVEMISKLGFISVHVHLGPTEKRPIAEATGDGWTLQKRCGRH